MKRILALMVSIIITSTIYAQPAKEQFTGNVRIVNYPWDWTQTDNIVMFVNDASEADIFVAAFDATNPGDLARYKQVSKSGTPDFVWLLFDEEDSVGLPCMRITYIESIRAHALKDFYAVVRVYFVEYGKQGINKKKPNNSMYRESSCPDPLIKQYIDTSVR